MGKIIVANWKMNPTKQAEARNLLLKLTKAKVGSQTKVVVCPPFIYLPEAHRILAQKKKIFLGAQNCFFEEKGAFTGETSPAMLKDMGVKFVILGHSERRLIIGESSDLVAKKIKEVLKLGLTPILCLGETADQRKAGETFSFLEKEMRESLRGISKSEIKNVYIAYEPIWAIGSGNFCNPDDVLSVSLFFRKLIAKSYSRSSAEKIKILYGGSVKAKNAEAYISQEGIDGLLIGGASLKAEEFLEIINKANNY